MADEVDTRVSLDLDPGILPAMDCYDDDTRPLLSAPETLMRDAHTALRAIHDAKAAAATDPTLNPSAQLLAVSDYANARMTPVTKAWDRISANLEANVRQFEEEMSAPVVAKASQLVSGEIRTYFKNLKTGPRMEAIQKAIQDRDEVTVTSICGAPAYLSGLDPEMQASFLREWHERTNPVAAKKLRAVQAAAAFLNQRGGLLLREWHKAVGVIEETKEGPNGRRIVTKTITPADVRRQRDAAQASFAIGKN